MFKRHMAAAAVAALSMSLSHTTVSAQVNNETRVYYLDVTGSMEDNGIWDKVRDNLKAAISSVSDETTNLEVVAWTDKAHALQRKSCKATSKGKRDLCDFVDNLTTERKCYTEVWVPFEDFYAKRKSGDTYFYLMTDGKTKDATKAKLHSAIDSWDDKTNSTCYGFYVMLCDDAVSADVESLIEQQDAQLWTVKSADVNIRRVRIAPSTIYAVRDADFVDVPIQGNFGNAKFDVKLQNGFYCLEHHEIVETDNGQKAIRLHLSKGETLPEEETIELSVKVADGSALPEFTFLVTSKFKVKCVNKLYPKLQISFK